MRDACYTGERDEGRLSVLARRRYLRTIFLGIAAMGTLVWAAVDQFDIPVEEMLDLFLTSAAVMGLVIVAAGLSVALWVGLRQLFKGRPD
ncbi:MAG: hypothetical protein AAGI11_07610 [Pseudomonadota bacterium]